MTDIQFIEHEDAVGLEVRDLEKRELFGRIIPYGEQIKVRGRNESFVKGSVAHLDPKATVLLFMHDQAQPVGRMQSLEERDDGAYGTFKVARTAKGDEVLQLAADGVLKGLSAGFLADVQTSDGVHRRIKSLPETSLVTFGAYPSAEVLSVRNMINEKEEIVSDNTITDTEANEASENVTVDLSAIETRMEGLDEKLNKLQILAEAPATETREAEITPVDWFVAEVEAQFRGNYERRNDLLADLQKRDIADAVGTFGGASTTASGLIENDYLAGQLVNVLDASRPLFSRAAKIDMPNSGSVLIPRVSQHTDVAERPTQMQEPQSRAFHVVTDSYTAKWYDGALQVSYELMATAEYDVLAMVFQDLLGRYAQVTEAEAIADVEDAIEAYGGALDTSTYADFAEDVATQAIEVRNATGLPATKLAVPWANWPTLIAFVDANDRRQFTSGDHSDGNLSFTGEAFALPGGIEVFGAGVTKPILFNDAALKVAEEAPLQLQATNVAQISRDVAILGRTLVVPRIPGGIVYFDAEPSS